MFNSSFGSDSRVFLSPLLRNNFSQTFLWLIFFQHRDINFFGCGTQLTPSKVNNLNAQVLRSITSRIIFSQSSDEIQI